MATIETKFGVGDVVWNATTATEKRRHPCPDCLGCRKWSCKSPAGATFEVECPRCAGGYQSNRDLCLDYTVHVPRAQRLTIGLVRANGSWETPPQHEYMAHETGIGSGSLYRENTLFATEEEALAHAKVAADLANADHAGWAAKQYDRTAQFCDYQLRDAAIASADDIRRRMGVRIQMLVEDLKDAQDLAEVRQSIERWENRVEEDA
jgi:hypothetical protein